MTSPLEWFSFENPSLLGFSMLQVLLDHDAGRLRCRYSDSNASQYSQHFENWRLFWPKGKKNCKYLPFRRS